MSNLRYLAGGAIREQVAQIPHGEPAPSSDGGGGGRRGARRRRRGSDRGGNRDQRPECAGSEKRAAASTCPPTQPAPSQTQSKIIAGKGNLVFQSVDNSTGGNPPRSQTKNI